MKTTQFIARLQEAQLATIPDEVAATVLRYIDNQKAQNQRLAQLKQDAKVAADAAFVAENNLTSTGYVSFCQEILNLLNAPKVDKPALVQAGQRFGAFLVNAKADDPDSNLEEYFDFLDHTELESTALSSYRQAHSYFMGGLYLYLEANNHQDVLSPLLALKRKAFGFVRYVDNTIGHQVATWKFAAKQYT